MEECNLVIPMNPNKVESSNGNFPLLLYKKNKT